MSETRMALVTGASHGIGRGIAIVLAEHGYDVAITYHSRRDDALAVKERIEAMGRRCFVRQASLEDPDVPVSVVEWAIGELGQLDLMVCNAGRTILSSILNLTNADIDVIFNLNCRAYLLCAGAAARHMVRRKAPGSIVFITSSRAERAYPEDALYGGFKAGIKRACESIALDLAPYGIRVNCVAPGATEINAVDEPIPGALDGIIPLGRKGTPREVGEAVAYLASDAAGYITGVSLRLDGGLILPGSPESMAASTHWRNPDWTKMQYEILMKEEES